MSVQNIHRHVLGEFLFDFDWRAAVLCGGFHMHPSTILPILDNEDRDENCDMRQSGNVAIGRAETFRTRTSPEVS